MNSPDPDPFRPPDADLGDARGLPPRPVRGIAMGILVDWGGTMALAIAFTIVYTAMLAARGLSEDAIIATLESSSSGIYSGLGLLNTIMGMAMSFAGGWVCVHVGRSPSLKPPAVLAGLSALFGFWLVEDNIDIGIFLMLTLFATSATMIGAWQAGRREPQR